MGWFLASVLGFAVLTAAVIAMARTDTARWEQEKKAARARSPRHPAGAVPPHARRRRVEFPGGVPAARAPVGARSRDEPATVEAS